MGNLLLDDSNSGAQTLKHRQVLPINKEMDAPRMPIARHSALTQTIAGGSMLLTTRLCTILTLSGLSLCGSDFYLAHVGPAPLRFAPEPTNADFRWPAPLANHLQTNTNVPASEKLSTPIILTNLLGVSDPAVTRTNSPAPEPPMEITVSSPASLMPNPVATDGNPLSAGNLLVVTPQMLADYLKATLDGSLKFPTNAPVGADIPFNPPTPKLPASEAIYRTR